MTTALTDRQNNDIDVLQMTDDEMLVEIKGRMVILANNYVELAKIVCPALRRGLDLSFMGGKLLNVLQKIECRQILPELAQKYMTCRVFDRIKNLPLDDQITICEKGTVEIAVRRDDEFTFRVLSIDSLTTDQMKLAFSNGRMRSKREMIGLLEEQQQPKEDPYDQSVVSFRIPSLSFDVTKAEAKLLKEKVEYCGGFAEFIKHAVKRMI